MDGQTQITNATYQQNLKQQLCMRTKFSENLDLQNMKYLKNEIQNPCS